MPQTDVEEDAWGSLRAFSERSAEETFRRLEQEEAADGQEPWGR